MRICIRLNRKPLRKRKYEISGVINNRFTGILFKVKAIRLYTIPYIGECMIKRTHPGVCWRRKLGRPVPFLDAFISTVDCCH